MPKLTFLGGVGTATGASILLEFGGKRVLVDCGILQGAKNAEEKNFEPFGFEPASVDFLLVTHAHMDHIGKIPKLVKEGFRGRIISTQETKELAWPMLKDALKVMKARHPNRTLFEDEDIEVALALWEGGNYGERIELFEDCFLEMLNAGHILGSSILNVTCGGKTIAFTGDLGNSPSPLLPDAEVPQNANYLVMESVYGDRNHQSKEERREKLKKIITEAIERRGDLVMPVFSIERTQVLLYELNNMIEDKEIPQILVFLDSPLALKVTGIYKKHQKDFNGKVKKEIKEGDDIFDFPGLRIVESAQESQEIENIKGPKIILAGSGMSEGGRVVDHEARILNNPANTLLLVGYQAPGTLGRMLEEGAKEISPPTPSYNKRGQDNGRLGSRKIKVKAKIETLKGYSSHMDSDHLIEFVEKAAPKKVFVIMGEPKSSLFLCQRIRDYLDIEAVYPEEGREYEL